MVAGWSFGELQAFTRYKAKRAGIADETINPWRTSQVCHRCHTLGIRKGDKFFCATCDVVLDADDNASMNIAAGGVAVNRPESELCASTSHGASESPAL
jgi:transposase